MGIPVISITLFILLGLQELIFSVYTPVHPAASGGCLIGRWIMEWWDRGENISLRDPWRKPVDESVQTTTARTILREIWYLHSPVLSLLRDNLTSFVLISFHFRGSWHKQHLCHIVETDGRRHPRCWHFDKWSLCNISSPLCLTSCSPSHSLKVKWAVLWLCCRELYWQYINGEYFYIFAFSKCF